MINFLNQSLWLDEATTALVSRMSLADIFSKFLPNDFHPPLYYLVLKFWVSLFGDSEVSLRVPSVIFALLTIYIVYRISKNYFAPLLLATSGLFFYYAGEARMYMMAAFLVSLAFFLFLKKKMLLFSIVLALLGMTDYVSLLILPVFWILGRKNIKNLLFSHIPLGLAFLIWSPIFINQLTAGVSQEGNAWWGILGTPTIKNIALIPVKFVLGRISFDDKLLYGFIAVCSVGLFAYILSRARKALVIWLWLTIPVALGIILSFKIPTLSYFRFLFCLPALYILMAVGIKKMGRYKNVIFGVVLLINMSSSLYYLATPKFQREDWRAAAAAIGESKIVLPADSQKEALIYYRKADQIVKVVDIVPTEKEVWLSRYVWEIVDPGDATRLKLEALGYNKAEEHNFNGVVLFKYTKNLYASGN